MSSKPHSPKKKTKIKIDLTVLAGRDLVAKDKNLMGKNTSSDPYIEVWADNDLVGKTPVVSKSLNPVWEKDNTFLMKLEGENPKVTLKIYDQDLIGDPDAMGTIVLKIPKKTGDNTDWYKVPANSAKNASGEIKIRLQTTKLKKKKDAGKKKAKSSALSDDEEDLDAADTSVFKKRGKSPTRVAVMPTLKIHKTSLLQGENIMANQKVAKLEQKLSDIERQLFQEAPVYKQHKNTRNSMMEQNTFLQEEVKALKIGKREKMKVLEEETAAILSDTIRVQLTILQGEDLAAKDTNIVGKKTTSDPYVEVRVKDEVIGRTKTIPKTLSPMWNERFDMDIKRGGKKLKLHIWDEDKMSEPDAMGVIILELPSDPHIDLTEWHEIPAQSAHNAKGSLRVRIETKLTEDPKPKIDFLEKQIQATEQEIEQVNALPKGNKAQREGRNSLMESVQFLQGEYKDLMKEKMRLENSGM